jgi:hypothetical protein
MQQPRQINQFTPLKLEPMNVAASQGNAVKEETLEAATIKGIRNTCITEQVACIQCSNVNKEPEQMVG